MNYLDRTLTAVNGAGSEVVTGPAFELWNRPYRTFTFQTVYNESGVEGAGGEDLVGTIEIQGSIDPRSRPRDPDHANADWTPLANLTMGDSQPDGAAGSGLINVSFIGLVAVRMVLTGTAGTGSFKSFIHTVKG